MLRRQFSAFDEFGQLSLRDAIAAAIAEADQAVAAGFALAMTVAERARGLNAWLAAALTVPGTSGAPTRTAMRLGTH